MEEVFEFLKNCGTFYIATIDGDQPRVRPFGVVNILFIYRASKSSWILIVTAAFGRHKKESQLFGFLFLF